MATDYAVIVARETAKWNEYQARKANPAPEKKTYLLADLKQPGDSQERRGFDDICQLHQGDFSQAGMWDDFNQDPGGAWDCHDPGWEFDQSTDHWGDAMERCVPSDELPGGWEEKARNLLEDVAEMQLA